MSEPASSQAELVLLEAWVADNPGSHGALRLAKAYRDHGRLDQARAVLGRGLAVNPENIEARALLADVLEQLGEADGALAQLIMAAQELGRHAAVYANLARLLRASGRPQEAARVKALAEAMAAGVGSLPSVGGLESATMAAIYAAQGHAKQAEDIYRTLLARDPANAEAQASMAETRRKASAGHARAAAGSAKVIGRLERLRAAALGRAALA